MIQKRSSKIEKERQVENSHSKSSIYFLTKTNFSFPFNSQILQFKQKEISHLFSSYKVQVWNVYKRDYPHCEKIREYLKLISTYIVFLTLVIEYSYH